MRSFPATLASCAVLVLSLLPGCDVADQHVYGPAPVVNPPVSNDVPHGTIGPVVNDEFGRAVDELAAIISGRGQALSAGRPELTAVVANLLDFPTP